MQSLLSLEPLARFLPSFSRVLVRPTTAPLLTVALFALCAMGCTPSIGDKCSLSTDCSLRGDRQCDVAQPGGYCTVLNCGGDSCPEEARCVLFHAAVPGCGYSDRSVARTARSFCMAACSDDSDCREGYVCRNPRGVPWDAIILDSDQTRTVCIPPERMSIDQVERSDAGVCGASGPNVKGDAGRITPVPVAEAGADAALDAGAGDAAVDAADAGAPDAADGGIQDSGIPDAPDGGG